MSAGDLERRAHGTVAGSIVVGLLASAERMVLVAGELHVTYEGQATAILKAGTYAYGPARRPHSGLCASAVPCVLFIAFESPVDALPSEKSATPGT